LKLEEVKQFLDTSSKPNVNVLWNLKHIWNLIICAWYYFSINW
jgi:hypothetical protein